MGGRLVIPNNAIFDDNCTNELKKHLCEYILKNNNKYVDEGFIIYIHSNYLKIWFNHHYYYVIIIMEEKQYYWHLKPYNKSYYTTFSKDINSFDFVILAIKEQDKIISKK